MTAWMDIAWTQQGIAETVGDGATPEIVAMFRDAGHPEVTSDETAWCAAFVGACLERCGKGSTRSLRARSYLDFGTPIDEPRVGAIVVFPRGTDPQSGHVGFVAGSTETTIAVLGGNQGGKVSVAHFQRSSVLGYRWPEAEATATDLAAAGSRTVTAALGQVRDAAKGAMALAGAAVANVTAPAAPLKPPAVTGHVQSLLSDAQLLQRFGVFCWQHAGWVLGALAVWWLGSMAVKAGWIVEARVADHNTGANTARKTGTEATDAVAA